MWPLIDVLKLHHPKDTEKSSVRALGGLELNRIFNELCGSYVTKNKISYKALAKEIFKTNPASLFNWRGFNPNYPNGHPIPLYALQKMLELHKLQNTDKHKEIVKCIKHLQCGRVSEKVNAQIYLTPELAKICGAHAADGCLNGVKNKGPLTARWDMGDQEKENINEAIKWIEICFEFKPIIMQKGKMAYVWSNKQVISRYLTQIFDFPIGPKSDIVKTPRILLQKDERLLDDANEGILRQLQLEFAKEVVNFDGHSTLSGRVVQVGLGVNSKELLKEVRDIFQKFGVNFHLYETKILTTSHEESRKLYLLGLFRGYKRQKFENLILQNTRKVEKQP